MESTAGRLAGRILVALVAAWLVSCEAAYARADKLNILFIMSDDVGVDNISAYSHGLVGYRTPNLDRIASEGVAFTDYYAEQSCTAGRSAFILGLFLFRGDLIVSSVAHALHPQGVDRFTAHGLNRRERAPSEVQKQLGKRSRGQWKRYAAGC